MGSKYTAAQNKATQKYIKSAYDTITFRVPKGMREIYNAHAESKNTSLTKLITELLNGDIENEVFLISNMNYTEIKGVIIGSEEKVSEWCEKYEVNHNKIYYEKLNVLTELEDGN